jgi:hypothetical protein
MSRCDGICSFLFFGPEWGEGVSDPVREKAKTNTGVLHGACGRTCVQDDGVLGDDGVMQWVQDDDFKGGRSL